MFQERAEASTGTRHTALGGICLAGLLLIVPGLLCLPARAETIHKKSIDPLNVLYEGLELNGDDYSDAVIVNIASGLKQLLLGTPGGTLEQVSFDSLSDEEKGSLPDMITEVDLDGDRKNELVVVNRNRLFKTADDRSFLRVLEYSVFFGLEAGTFESVRLSSFSDAQRESLLFHARLLLVPPRSAEADAVAIQVSRYR